MATRPRLVFSSDGPAHNLRSAAQIRASRAPRSAKQRKAQPFCGFNYYLGGALSVLRKIEAKFPDVDTTRAEGAILKLKRELRGAYRSLRK